MRNWFIYNGINSMEFENLIVEELPNIDFANEEVNVIDVPGRNGNLHIKTGRYNSSLKTIKCTLKNLNDIDTLASWLCGSGEIIFSSQNDRYFKCYFTNQISLERVMVQFRSFIIQLECEPFGYLLDGRNQIEVDQDMLLFNPGTMISAPVIKLIGNGDLYITINSKLVTIKNVINEVTLDCDLMTCTSNGINKGRDMIGEYPIFSPGENLISIGENTSAVIIPKWRNL